MKKKQKTGKKYRGRSIRTVASAIRVLLRTPGKRRKNERKKHTGVVEGKQKEIDDTVDKEEEKEVEDNKKINKRIDANHSTAPMCPPFVPQAPQAPARRR